MRRFVLFYFFFIICDIIARVGRKAKEKRPRRSGEHATCLFV